MSQERQSDAIPDALRAQVVERLNRYCEERVPPGIRDKLRLEWTMREASFTLTERRPHFVRRDEWTESKVAQFRYDVEAGQWTLFCCDRDSKWHEYLELAPSSHFETLLAEVNEDPTGIFWG